jgi:rhodanese-related sulfurtransferase
VKFVQDNIWLVIAAIVSGAMLVWPLVSRRLSGVPEVGVTDAVQMINRKDALILDVREPAEFAGGHVPHARNLPLSQLEKRLDEIRKFKDRPAVIFCQSGSRSHSACGVLKKAGFTQLAVLAGGVGAWQQANLPLEK